MAQNANAYCWSLEGMWGPISDPGIFQFTRRVGLEIAGINVDGSPYRDFAVNEIVDRILRLPRNVKKLLTGTSLGCNNIAIVAAYVYLKDPTCVIDGLWGFQASQGGAKAIIGTDYQGITPNVLFAHQMSSDNPINFGLGSYRWQKAPGNYKTSLILDHNMDLHPGDGNPATQNMFLDEMRRVVERPRGA